MQQPTPEIQARFWAKVAKTDTCWVWCAYTDRHGYGYFSIEKRTYKAHRVAYTWLIGPIPGGLVLDHLCRVSACVNPAHLEAVTQHENILRGDAVLRGHCRRGHILIGANGEPINRTTKTGQCRTCHNQIKRAWARKNRAAAASKGGS